jgi:hypothetical protein
VNEEQLTRAAFVRRVAGGAAGLTVLGALGDVPAWARVDAVRYHRFVSRPDLRAQYVTVRRSAPGRCGGYLFLAPNSGPGLRGPMILDDRGEVVWFRPTKPHTAMNFRTASWKGEPVLTWWEGSTERGLGRGDHVVADRSYREIARFPAGGGRESDLHEFLLTPRGTALVTSWEVVPADLRPVGGPANGQAIGGVVQEIAVPSGRVLFEWRSIDHVALDETHARYTGHPLDYFHVNSIDLAADGNLIVSARNTWAVYKLDRTSGRVIWRLGGKKSDFEMGPGTQFAWQHDARHHGTTNVISIFDDGARPKVERQSRALLIKVQEKPMRATLVRHYVHEPPVLAYALGSVQLLPNGNVLVGWGTEPYVTEYRPDGGVVLDLRLPERGQNYRALRLPWEGRPVEPPALAARRNGSRWEVFTSWNGATEVASWRLEGGLRATTMAALATKPKRHFETRFDVPASVRHVRVAALDAQGKVLRRSGELAV